MRWGSLTLRWPESVRELIARRYRSGRGEWLLGGGSWPIEVPLGCPSEHEASQNIEAVREWIVAWQSWKGAGEVQWTQRHWRSLGTQWAPRHIVIHTAMDAAACIGEQDRWRSAQSRCNKILERRPFLGRKLSRYFDLLADATPAEMERIERVLDWLESGNAHAFYPRQLPIAGLDTKWIESRAAIVADLAGCPLEFRRPPAIVRMRMLDSVLSEAAGGLSDVTAPIDELAALAIRPACVWIVENLQTGLAFEPLKDTVVFMGLGYGVSLLASIPWVARAECRYWGDIDTHGFAMLSRARSVLPNLRSELMDEATLLRFQDLWGVEPAQCGTIDNASLTAAEMDLFLSLQRHKWAPSVRLEQERIGWDYAWQRVLASHPIR